MLKFIKISNAKDAANVISDRLFKELDAGKKVLWLLSGGGNITIQVEAMKRLPEDLIQNLTVMFCDERYGPPGHKDSNFKLLIDSGFNPGKAKLVPTLTSADTSLEMAAARYGKEIEAAINTANTVIAQLGMGTDGHIAGILPGTEAVNAKGIVFAYHTDQYDRITMTFESLKRSSVSYLFAFGAGKVEQLTRLRDEDIILGVQPAQWLKSLPESYVYNDQIEGGQQ